jgi:glycosyltransferase involved in cell wall biosynthesis
VTVRACTIIAKNYLPAARVMGRSFRDHHPFGSLTTLVLDDLYGELDPAEEPFDIIRLPDLPLPRDEAHRMAAIYDVMEFATSLKPWLLRSMLDDGCTEVVYLDPDILLFAPLDDVAALAADHGIVLTPHLTAPMARDGKMMSETSVLASGIYNLGFLAINDRQRPFLDFWAERLRRECVIDHQNMRFVDQRWMDFVPGIYDCHILRDPGYNVGYWNLGQRQVESTGASYEVNGSPLKFFHFSGYSPDAPHLLSKHQGEQPRVLLSEHPAVARICREYRSALLENGYSKMITADYELARMANGIPLDRSVRTVYRRRLDEAERNGGPMPPDPFEAEGAEQLVESLNQTGPGTPTLSFYLSTLFAVRPELHAHFPDPQGRDFDPFMAWARSGNVHHRLTDLAIGEPCSRWEHPQEWSSPDALAPGILVTGYLRAELGVGQLGRLALAVVEEAGIPRATLVESGTASRQNHPFAHDERNDLNVNLVCVNADRIPELAGRVGPGFFDGRYTIGLWAWENEVFPHDFANAFDYVDEVWTISEFTRAAVAAASNKPVFTFPLPIVEPTPPPGLDRTTLGLPDGPMFLFCFDLLSILERKNPLGVITAFCRAFQPDEGPLLVLKVLNGHLRMVDLERIKLAASERTDVLVIDRYFDHDQNSALMATCDCYVSLHRCEGFGLTMGEAMALGKPVIATAYSGNMDFMTTDTSYLVGWTDTTVPAGCDPYPAGAPWAEPDLEEAAQLMRDVVVHREEAEALGRRARTHVLHSHGLRSRRDFMADRFRHAQHTLAERRTSS